MATIRSYDSNGPYFPPTQCVYQANSLTDAIRHIRQCMADSEYQIGLFDDNGECKGIWQDEGEPELDGEGGWTYASKAYVLYRPGSMSDSLWQLCLSKFKRA